MTQCSGVCLRAVVALAVVAAVACEGGQFGRSATRPLPKRRNAGPSVDVDALRERYRQRLKSENPCLPLPPPIDPPPLPTVPNSFMTELEFTFQDASLQRVIHGVEMYDSASLRGVIDYDLAEGIVLTRPSVLRESIHYNILMDEALFITIDDPCTITGGEDCNAFKFCAAGKIDDMNAVLHEMFGIVDTSNGGKFMGAMGLMQFGPQFNYTFAGYDDCRGAKCQVFEACINKPDEDNATLFYTYYWTAPDWKIQSNNKPVPIALSIYGTAPISGVISKKIEMHIEFFDYKRGWIPALDVLEAPVDVYCYNRATYISPPKAVSTFHFASELVGGFNVPLPDGENQTMSIHFRAVFPQREWYDWNTRISRLDYIPFFIFGADRRFENLTEDIQDFNQGLAYKVKPRLKYCKIKPIENITNWGDVVVGDDGTVHMQSPWNFEDLDEPLQYNGRHWERGLWADVWVGVKKNPLLKLNETYVWYFASPFTGEILGRSSKIQIPTTDKVPIKLEKYLSLAEGLPHILYHIYGYESIIPDTHNHDVSLCYDSHQMRHFNFDMPHDSLLKSLYLRENLKYAIQGSLSEAGGVSPLRINKIAIKEMPDALKVTFTLLEKPPVDGDVVGGNVESSMDQAATKIKNTIDSSQLVVLVKYGNKPDETRITIAKLVAMPMTLTEVVRGDGSPQGTQIMTGYSPGDMGGLAIGMIILGALVGFGAMYFYFSKR